MKKTKLLALLMLVISVMLLTFTSCDVVENVIGMIPGIGGTDEHVHAFGDATCETPATCECGATEGEALGHKFVDGKCACGAEDPNCVPPHVHNHEAVVTAPTCTEAGYTTYTCACGDTYTADEVEAKGHYYETVVTDPTCTEAGSTVYTCACGDTYTEEIKATGHTHEAVVTDPTCTEAGYTTYTCACGDTYTADEVEAKGHSHTETVTTEPTCTTKGLKTFTCACGDTYTEEIDTLAHVDTNLDITCDFEGCTKRILPAADSKVSLFTANHMIIVSLTSNYYVEGTVTEVVDAKNGIFVIEDEAGDTILVRLPKNADGLVYSSWTDLKVVVGDTIQVYGKPSRNTSTATSPQKAKIESGVLTVLKHTHSFSEVTCSEDSVCDCLAVGEKALGHIDENGDNVCDRCPWKMNMAVSNIVVATDPAVANGVITNGSDGKALYWTWSDDNFDVVIHKGTSTYTVYTTAKAYMQLKKNNTLTVSSKNDLVMKSIKISATNANQFAYLKDAIGTAYTYTEDADAFTVTIEYNSADDFTFANVGNSTVYISGVEIVYEKQSTT